jgi:hypothetical protein
MVNRCAMSGFPMGLKFQCVDCFDGQLLYVMFVTIAGLWFITNNAQNAV